MSGRDLQGRGGRVADVAVIAWTGLWLVAGYLVADGFAQLRALGRQRADAGGAVGESG